MMKFVVLSAGVLVVSGCVASGASHTIEATRSGDAKMTCSEIQAEMDELDGMIAEAQGADSAAHATNVGASVGGHAVSMGGLPYAGILLSHSGRAAKMSAAQKMELAQQAEMRKSTLTGLSVGKGC